MRNAGPDVELAVVSDAVLDALVLAATTQADAGDVTPPLTPGRSWSAERVAWLRAFHVDRRPGLDGPAGEITWAVLVDAAVVGSVRLQRTEHPAVLEIGLWLIRDVRGRGVGAAVLDLVVRRAAGLGASELRAQTTVGNERALRLLRRHGFAFDDGATDAVRAVRSVRQG